jgi:hypothetical protein
VIAVFNCDKFRNASLHKLGGLVTLKIDLKPAVSRRKEAQAKQSGAQPYHLPNPRCMFAILPSSVIDCSFP